MRFKDDLNQVNGEAQQRGVLVAVSCKEKH